MPALTPVSNFAGGDAFGIIENGSLFIPFGQYRSAQGVQRVDAGTAQRLRASFNLRDDLAGRGVPIYAGQPDIPGTKSSDPAAPALGWVRGVMAEGEGIRLATKWGRFGEQAANDSRWRFCAPFWMCQRAGTGAVLEPVKLISLALTNRVPESAMAAANDAQPLNAMPKIHTAVVEAELAQLLNTGRITLAESRSLRGKLIAASNDAEFRSEIHAFLGRQSHPAIKVQSVTLGLGAARSRIKTHGFKLNQPKSH